MGRFEILNEERVLNNIRLYFNNDNSCIESIPFPNGSEYSIAIDGLEIEMSEDMRLLCVDGWASLGKKRVLVPPKAKKCAVRYFPNGYNDINDIMKGEGLVHGEVFSIENNSKQNTWETYCDRNSGWYVKGELKYSNSDIAVEFAPQSVIVLRHTKMIALWLLPELSNTNEINRVSKTDN